MIEPVQKPEFKQPIPPESITELGDPSPETPQYVPEKSSDSGELIPDGQEGNNTPELGSITSKKDENTPKTPEPINVNNKTDTITPDTPVRGDTLTTLGNEIESTANTGFKEEIEKIY